MHWKVLLSDIDISAAELKAVQQVLKSRWLSLGPVTAEFEKRFAKFIGVKHALAVSNGTAALHLALLSVGVGPGDEVLVPSLTFVATVNSILYCGAKPVFVDINGPVNLNLSVADLEQKLSYRTKAVLVVHYAGYPANLPAIKEAVKRAEQKFGRRIFIIEDAAHAPGASIAGKKCGAWGEVGCFSFFANKNLVTGEGGMLVTNSDPLAARLKLLRSHGMTSLSWERHTGHAHSYDVVDLGYNYRLTEVEATLGLVQLKKLKKANRKRRVLTKLYQRQLKNLSEIQIPFKKFTGRSAYHIFPILLSEGIDRAAFISTLKSKGIQISVHYPPVHQFSYYKNRYFTSNLPLTELVGQTEVTLPLHPLMTEKDVAYICRSIKETISKL
jgi:dTDP-4-amino-4,6-dideoxygalactose transaminase